MSQTPVTQPDSATPGLSGGRFPGFGSDTFNVALLQYACSPDPEQNLKTALQHIEQAVVEGGAQIVCLPELFNRTYFCSAYSHDFFDWAEPIPGPTVSRIQVIAKKLEAVVVVPIFEKRAPGVYHNSVAVIDADGEIVGVYRKMHIPDDPLFYEKFYFTPGDRNGPDGGYRIFETRYAKIGVLICWDQWYPEAARITSLLGAEILLYPTAIGWHPKEKDEYGTAQVEAWTTMQRSHAIANGIYVGAANRVGFESTPGTDGLEFFGNSFLFDPFGRLLSHAPSDVTGAIVHQCSRKLSEEVRRHWPFLRDRRVDSYEPILSRFLTPTPGR